jgi:putative periplasmic protein
LFPDVINLKEQKSYLSEIKKDLVAKGISNVYKGEDKSNIITIGNDKNKPTIVMFSDPECPYCRAELERIETTLKGSNVQIVLTPVHDKSSLQKSFLAYKEVKTAKSDSEKIKILRKYFDENYTIEGGAVSDAEAQKIDDLRKKYFAAGVRSVPTVVNLSDLQK